MPRVLLVLGACYALACASGSGFLIAPAVTGSVTGRVVATPHEAAGGAGPVVLYLVPLESEAGGEAEATSRTVAQDGDHSWPALAAVAAGDRVVFQGHGSVRHRIFSYSETNAFDVTVEGPGASDPVTLKHEGAVRFYCSLHPWESGLVFVAPSAWFAMSDAAGSYEIRDVPAGRYRLRAFAEPRIRLDEVVVVGGEEPAAVDVPVPHSGGS